MIGVALKGLAARKVRALLTALAVVIGVSMISGTYILTDTMQKAFDGIFDSSYAQTDAVIGGKEIVKGSTSGSATVPESLLTKVRALPEVKAAGGTIGLNEENKSEIIGRDGKPLGGAGRQPDVRARLRHRPAAVQPAQAQERRLGARARRRSSSTPAPPPTRSSPSGDTVKVATLGVRKNYEVTGVATFGDVDSLGGATMAIFDPDTARSLLHKEGVWDGISIQAEGRHLVGRAGQGRGAARPRLAAGRRTAPSRRRRTPRRPTAGWTSSATSSSGSARSRCSSARS